MDIYYERILYNSKVLVLICFATRVRRYWCGRPKPSMKGNCYSYSCSGTLGRTHATSHLYWDARRTWLYKQEDNDLMVFPLVHYNFLIENRWMEHFRVVATRTRAHTHTHTWYLHSQSGLNWKSNTQSPIRPVHRTCYSSGLNQAATAVSLVGPLSLPVDTSSSDGALRFINGTFWRVVLRVNEFRWFIHHLSHFTSLLYLFPHWKRRP